MGAVTAILHAAKYSSESCCLVVDSPFSNLQAVMSEIASNKTKLPKFIIDTALSILKGKIQDIIGVDIFQFNIVKKVQECQQPVLFLYAGADNLISPSHTKTLFDSCQSKKRIFQFEGNHNTIRPKAFYEEVMQFLREQFLSGTQAPSTDA